MFTHVFFDIGGVLGTDGWGRNQRARGVERFGLDAGFDRRHQEVAESWEAGRMTLDDYLDEAVFNVTRPFTREQFTAFMYDQSQPFFDSIEIVRAVAAVGRYRLMTLNNESVELNTYRLRHFGLIGLFDAFLSSCWLGVTKPATKFFELALAITQANPVHALFVDDREQNLVPVRALGMRTILFQNAAQLRTDLMAARVLD